MNREILKRFIIVLIVVLLNIANNTLFAAIPAVTITNPSKYEVNTGESISYKVIADPEYTEIFNISKDNIILKGFTAIITIEATGTYSKNITFSNIKGDVSSGKTFVLSEGVAISKEGEQSNRINAPSFSIKEEKADQIAPVLNISQPNNKTVNNNGSVTYNVTATDNESVVYFEISTSDITVKGFSANVTITGNGNSKTIQFTKIKNTGTNTDKYFIINAGVAKDSCGNSNNSTTSKSFNIPVEVNKPEEVEKPEQVKDKTIKTKKQATSKTVKKSTVITKPKEENIVTKMKITEISYNYDLNEIGSINNENNTLVSWLKSKRQDVKFVQENNYVAKNQTISYMIDYYNGSTEKINEAKFEITIPYKVEVLEVATNGLVTQNKSSTIISWKIDNINAGSYCRLEAKVKYKENTKLEQESNISEVFYVSLKTTINNTDSYSYLRQIFVDKTEGKIGTNKSYLTFIDNTNIIRPEEEITRVEFAKMLADSGIVEVKKDSNKYKEFKDCEKIPSDAKDAISALVEINIINAFPDGEFKPNNPILVEDAIETIVKAAMYMSNGKLAVKNAVFLNNYSITDENKQISSKSNYIMEIIRQNIISKDDIDIDKYTLRKDAINMINALTFRGPYVEKLPETSLKISDLKENSIYFYNIIGALNNYTYIYSDNLWQEIIKTN